jgi:hypothetical protein
MQAEGTEHRALIEATKRGELDDQTEYRVVSANRKDPSARQVMHEDTADAAKDCATALEAYYREQKQDVDVWIEYRRVTPWERW